MKLMFKIAAVAILIVGVKVSSGQKLPVVGIKTNILYDALTTINLGVEVGLGRKTSIDVSSSYNPWKFSNGNMFKHWLIQPSFRYWVIERFGGLFVGANLHYGVYNVTNLPLSAPPSTRYQGWLVGGGATVGYAWVVGGRFTMEAEVGLGYAHIKYSKYDANECWQRVSTGHYNYVGPTKIALSIILTL